MRNFQIKEKGTSLRGNQLVVLQIKEQLGPKRIPLNSLSQSNAKRKDKNLYKFKFIIYSDRSEAFYLYIFVLVYAAVDEWIISYFL